MESIYISDVTIQIPFMLYLFISISPSDTGGRDGSPCSPERHPTRAPVYQGRRLAVFSYRDITHNISISQQHENHMFDQGCDQQPLHCSRRSTTTSATVLSSSSSFLSCCGPFSERTLKQDCIKKVWITLYCNVMKATHI